MQHRRPLRAINQFGIYSFCVHMRVYAAHKLCVLSVCTSMDWAGNIRISIYASHRARNETEEKWIAGPWNFSVCFSGFLFSCIFWVCVVATIGDTAEWPDLMRFHSLSGFCHRASTTHKLTAEAHLNVGTTSTLNIFSMWFILFFFMAWQGERASILSSSTQERTHTLSGRDLSRIDKKKHRIAGCHRYFCHDFPGTQLSTSSSSSTSPPSTDFESCSW